MARNVTLAATQMACSWDIRANVDTAEALVRAAAGHGAHVVLLQELYETPYFCIDEESRHLDLARPLDGHPTVARMQRLAAELEVVIPVSFFERAGRVFFNSLAMVDADGAVLGVYRKSHIPDATGYREKFYFSPGDTGFKVWRTRAGVLGAVLRLSATRAEEAAIEQRSRKLLDYCGIARHANELARNLA
jgi:N-carbamoylputrescine amidase